MKSLYRWLTSLLLMLATVVLVNCSGAPGCPQVTFGSTQTCSGGGTGFGSGGNGGGSGGGGGGGGGGGTVDASAAAALVYYGVSSVSAAGVTNAGAFGTLSSYTAPALGGSFPDDMIIVNKQFLYVPQGDATVAGFSINRGTGALTAITGSPFTVTGSGVTADDVATDPAGKFLFVGSESPGGGQVWVFTINSTNGQLTEVVGSPFTAGLSSSDEMTVDASGKFLYVAQTDPLAGIAGFSIANNGTLTALNGGVPFQLGVAQIHASTVNEFLLGVAEVADGTTNATVKSISVFSIDPNSGTPTAVTGSPFATATGNAPFDFAISPNGQFVYAVEAVVGGNTDGPIEGFKLNTTSGALTSLGTFSGVPTSESCRFDQSGNILFCVNTLAGTTLTVNAVNSSGNVTHVADLPVVQNFPFAVTD